MYSNPTLELQASVEPYSNQLVRQTDTFPPPQKKETNRDSGQCLTDWLSTMSAVAMQPELQANERNLLAPAEYILLPHTQALKMKKWNGLIFPQCRCSHGPGKMMPCCCIDSRVQCMATIPDGVR